MILIDPCYRPVPTFPILPAPKPIQSDLPFPLDREIVNFLREQPAPVATWWMANTVANALKPINRAERRELTQKILSRITPLIYARRIRRIGRKHLALR
jgi:hypothetical protein